MDYVLISGIITGAVVVGGIVALRSWWKNGKAARKGRLGEKQVSKILASMKRKDFIVMNDIILPTVQGRTSQIDHLVISTHGIFIIETKSHSGRITGSEFTQCWEQKLPSMSRSFYNPLLQNASHIKTLKRLLPELEEKLFISVVVFTEAHRLDIKADRIIQKRMFLPDRSINRTLIPSEMKPRRWWNPSKEVRLDENKNVILISELADDLKMHRKVLSREEIIYLAEKVRKYVVDDSGIRKQHTEYARATSRSISREIRQGICPRCQGRLIVKKTENGEFLGCENFPRCRFSCSLDV